MIMIAVAMETKMMPSSLVARQASWISDTDLFWVTCPVGVQSGQTAMSKYLRNGTAAIALALFGGAIAVIGDHRCLALLFLGAAALLGLVVIVMAVISERKFRHNSKKLAAYLADADELFHRSVREQAAYDKWVADLNSWYKNCDEMLTNHLSPTHSALFRDVSEGGMIHVPGFNSDHMDSKNILRRYIANLKGITNSYLRREID